MTGDVRFRILALSKESLVVSRVLVLVLSLLVAPILASQGMARVAADMPPMAAAEPCSSHEPCSGGADHKAVTHAGLACTVSCVTAVGVLPSAWAAMPVAVLTGPAQVTPSDRFPAMTSWPPPLPPPRT